MKKEDVYEVAFEPEWSRIIQGTYKAIVSSGNLKITNDELTDLMDGCYDTHIHAGPDS